MFGRPFKTLENGVLVSTIVRWILFFFAAAVASGSLQSPFDGVAVAFVMMINIATSHTGMVGQYFVVLLQNKLWADQLTDRLFVKMAVDHVRNGTANTIDVDELYRLATKEAAADIKMAADDTEIFGPGWPKTARAFSVIGRTLAAIVSYAVYYGAALWVGSVGKNM